MAQGCGVRRGISALGGGHVACSDSVLLKHLANADSVPGKSYNDGLYIIIFRIHLTALREPGNEGVNVTPGCT